MDTFILSPAHTDAYVECSSRHVQATGKLFKKQIFRWGEFSHPMNPDIKINIDREFYDTLKKNFDDQVCPIVQIPLANEKNEHVESPDRNIGEVVDMSADEDGVNVYIDVRRHGEDVGKTILGASAKFHMNYLDTRTNERVGPTLIHVAATNRPFLVNLSDFESISASAADTNGEDVILLSDAQSNEYEISEEETHMTKEELIIALSEHGIDVAAGQQALADVEGFVALSNVLGEDVVATPEALSNTIVELTNSISERDAQIADREERIQTLTATIQEASLSNAEAEVDGLIEKGRILPAWRDEMVQLSMNDRDKFNTFVLPEAYAEFELSEQGFTSSKSNLNEDPDAAAKAEGARLANHTK